MVRFLAVLCKYRIAPNTLVEDTMHCLLSYRVNDQIQDAFFRIKLITTLAIAARDTILRSRPIKNCVIHFMLYFEEFVLLQQPLPIDLQIDIDEMYSVLKIKRNPFSTHEDALEAIGRSRVREKSHMPNQVLQPISESGTEEDSDIDIQSNAYDLDESEIPSESGSNCEEAWSSEEELERRSIGRSAEEESFERELALAMGTTNLAETSRTHVHKHSNQTQNTEESHRMSFKIMVKKGGRDDKSKDVHIPVSSGVVLRLEQKKEAAAAEKAALKRMVLASEF